MSKHTPGPWFVVNVGDDDEPMYSVKAERIRGRGPTHEVALCATGDSTQEMETANARLISAAPDLKALAVALDNFWTADFPGGPDAPIDANGHFRLSDDTTALWRQCRAAIAKAEGRQ